MLNKKKILIPTYQKTYSVDQIKDQEIIGPVAFYLFYIFIYNFLIDTVGYEPLY